MKKSLWIVLALSTLLAMFIIAGCTQTTPVTSPTVAPTTAPTTAPASACPSKTTVTTITELYSGWGSDLSAAGIALAANGTFKVNINFDKPISLRDLSTASWKIQVARYVLYDYLMVFGATQLMPKKERPFPSLSYMYISGGKHDKTGSDQLLATPLQVELSPNAKTVFITVYLAEEPLLPDADGLYNNILFQGWQRNTNIKYYGLICSENDYDSYIEAANNSPTNNRGEELYPPLFKGVSSQYADVVYWTYSGPTIYDESGVPCPDLCGLSDNKCCELPICTTCVSNCPIGAAVGTCQ